MTGASHTRLAYCMGKSSGLEKLSSRACFIHCHTCHIATTEYTIITALTTTTTLLHRLMAPSVMKPPGTHAFNTNGAMVRLVMMAPIHDTVFHWPH